MPQNKPFYEGFLARHFPSWAERRETARARHSVIEASFRGGLQTRTSTPWGDSVSYEGSTTGSRQNLAAQCNRARKTARTNAIGKSLLNTETDNVVCDGFRLQSRTAALAPSDAAASAKEKLDAFDREAEDRWATWLELYADRRGLFGATQLQRQFYRSPRRDGDGGIVLIDKGGVSQVQYIPRDLIKTPDGKYGDKSIIDGVEIDAAGRPIAFHILATDEWGKRAFTRIPASSFVYLTPTLEDDEDLAIRGETCFSQVFEKLDQLDGYIEAVVIAARMAAVFGLIFKQENATAAHGALPTLTNSQGNQQQAITLENGTVRYMGTKGEVVQVEAQQPLQQAPDWIRTLCRVIGTAFDMPLELVLKDLSQVNFASARIGLLGYYRACAKRQSWFKARCLDRIYRWWIDREVKLDRFTTAVPQGIGRDGRPLFESHEFRAVGWDYTDPVSESQADLLQMTMGVKTPQMIAGERGRDFEEMQVQLAAAMALRRLHKLPELPLSSLVQQQKQDGQGGAGGSASGDADGRDQGGPPRDGGEEREQETDEDEIDEA